MASKATTRQQAGKSARELGRDWEILIQGKLSPLRQAGRLVFRKNPKQVRTVRDPDGGVQIIATGEGPPDFTVRSGGVTWELEAKATGAERWPYKSLKLHQATQLDAWQEQGCICGLLINIVGIGLAVPWPVIGPRWMAWHYGPQPAPSGTASIHIRELRRLGIELDLGGEWLSWLANPTPIRGAVPRLPGEDDHPCQPSMF